MNRIEQENQENWVFACVERLVDNFPWSEHNIEVEDRIMLEEILTDGLMGELSNAETFVKICLDNGIIEEDYFD